IQMRAVTYAMSGIPATSAAGTAYSVTLTARNNLGNTATSYVGSANLSSNDVAAIFPPSVTFNAGVASFSVTFRTLGARTLTATDSVNGTLTATASTTVQAGAARTYVISGVPAMSVAGAGNAVTLTAKDAAGNTATGYAGTANLSSSDVAAVFSASVG